MGSKGRVPSPPIRRHLPGPGMMHPDPFGPSIRPPPGAYPPFDMLPPPEVLEQKLAVQHVEMQRLGAENERLSATHVVLRQLLVAGQQELQRLQAQVGAVKHEKERQMRVLMDKTAKMEVDLKAAEPIKMELQRARADAQNLIAARQELITKVQHLTQDYQRIHSDVQQIPALMSELEGLRQEYQHCRSTYDYEKKLYDDHYESLQVMDKNYISMAREVDKLRADLANAANIEQKTGAPYGDQNAVALYGATTSGYKVSEFAAHQSVESNAYEDGYNVSQGHGAPPSTVSPYGGGPVGSAPARGGYDAARGSGYYAARGPAYDAPREHGYEVARGSGYEASKVLGYDAPLRSTGGPQGQVAAPVNSVPYGSTTSPNLAVGGYNTQLKGGKPATPPNFAGGGYEAQLRGGNPVRR